MEMKVLWTEASIERLKDIFDYYSSKASYSVAQKLISGILEYLEVLVTNPNIGQREELLKNRRNDYHYLIYRNYKIIDWKAGNIIYIATIFDTRQNPLRLKKSVE